ncbi:hypothetical protein AMTR_s00077p00111800 [Amborella trichopoda]|uniref:Uncharacterized protein n=2 Tax=Amborella trichopoda TaxID=13333 RepID=W1PB13_AMBTC|nr:hypothetical protein AMTR_s00077p00111800 [Amborella trichopoda]
MGCCRNPLHYRNLGYSLRFKFRNLGFLLGFLLVFSSLDETSGSIHGYSRASFSPQMNAYFFHGGSEGIYASSVDVNGSDGGAKGQSFIRFESITFRRTKESASVHNDMEQKTGLVEALIVEIKDRDRIGAGHLNSDDLCCTLELSKEGHCNQGEVFIRPNKDSPKWPNRIQTFFQGAAEEANMGTQTVYVEKTGMYYLYFMFCDPQLKGTRISGKTVWKNPGGYLPGKMATLMIFYGFMSLAYLALGLIWFLQFV